MSSSLMQPRSRTMEPQVGRGAATGLDESSDRTLPEESLKCEPDEPIFE